jgi:hypothetical protein
MPTASSMTETSPHISAPASATLITQDGMRMELPIRELSRYEAFLSTPTLVAAAGDTVSVELSTLDRSQTVVLKTLVFKAVMAPPEEGSGLLGLRLQFIQMTPEEEQRLGELLQSLLAGPGGQRRAYPRISHRMMVTCEAADNSRAVLRDIGLGGAGIWIEHPLALGEDVALELTRPGKAPLPLLANVVSFRMAQLGEPYHLAGLRFRELPPQVQEELRSFLASLLGP